LIGADLPAYVFTFILTSIQSAASFKTAPSN